MLVNQNHETNTVLDHSDQRGKRRFPSENISTAVLVLACILMVFFSHFISPSLGSWRQVETVLVIGTFLVIASFGQGLIILTGGLDLSVGSIIALGGVVAADIGGGSGPLAIYTVPIALLLCGFVGLLSGMGVAFLRIPAFIVTLAMSLILHGAVLGVTGGTPGGGAPPVAAWLMKSNLFGIRTIVFALVLFIIFAWFLQEKSIIGRYWYATGNNRKAAKIAGIPFFVSNILPYAISGVCYGLVGVLLVGYSHGATLDMGEEYTLFSIAAVVIGGSSIMGGRGGYLGTAAGALMLTFLATILQALNMGIAYRTILSGGVILLALISMARGTKG